MRRTIDAVWWACRALKYEYVHFWSRHGMLSMPESRSRGSLHYHLYSDTLTWDCLDLDHCGIPLNKGRRFGSYYNAGYIAWYALIRLNSHLLGTDKDGRKTFLRQAEWLAREVVKRDDSAAVWPVPVNWREGPCKLKAPWLSATNQGLAISVLVRAYRLTMDRAFLELAITASRVFDLSIDQGGVRTVTDKGPGVFYAEHAAHPTPKVVDGFLYSLLGLYDLSQESEDPHITGLFSAGIDGLKTLLPYWTYRNKWSWYGSQLYLAHPEYQYLHHAQLESLSRLTLDACLASYALAWDPRKTTMAHKLEIYLIFIITKNLCRLKYCKHPFE